MAETQTQLKQSPEVIDLRDFSAEQVTRTREDVLRALLDPPIERAGQTYNYGNYETAVDSGLIDQFYYDADKGHDGIVHILSGDVTEAGNGSLEISGYHHESSASSPDTYVDVTDKNRVGDKRYFRQFPFEPYGAHVVINGYAKTVFKRDANGEFSEVSASSSMFPKEYDALTVLRSTVIARDSRDKTQDEPGRENRIVAEGYAPLLDGETFMKLRLILDRDTDQIVAAWPAIKKTGVMKLSEKAIEQHLGL